MIEKLLKHPWVVIIVIAAITLFFALQLPKAQLDNNNLRFVPSTDPARIISAKIDDTFGSSLFVLVGLERKYGTVFDRDFLFRIREFEDRVKTLNIVGDVNSIMSTEYIWGSGGSVIVEDLVSETFSGSPEEIAALRQRLLSWNMYDRSLLSDDFRATQIYVPLEIPSEDAGKPEVVGRYTEIRKIAEEMFSGMASVYVTGLPAFSGAINDAMFADLRLLVPLVILVVIFIVFLPMRRISFVLLSLLSVLIAVIWSIGAMPLFGIKLTILSTVLPVILIAVGNSYSLHVVIHYIEGSGRDLGSMTYREHRDFVQGMIGVITVPVFLAALTTLVSFLAFCVTMVLPIREFGFFATFGVAASYVIAMTLTPSILILRGPKPLRGKRKEGQSLAAYKIADYLTRIVRHKYRVLAVTLAVFLVSLYGATKVVIDNIMVEYFRRDSDIVRSDEFIRTRFGGSKVISVVAEADSPELLLHPDTLSALDRLGAYLASDVPEVGKVMGFTDLIKRINQVFNAGEDPSGLKPAPETTDAADAGDFGFGGDGFGFEESGAGGDDFGFGDFAEGDTNLTDTGAADTASTDTVSTGAEPALTAGELMVLLDQAVSFSNDPSARDLVRELKRLTNYDGEAYYEIPTNPARYGKKTREDLTGLVSNYLVLLSGNIGDYANDSLEPTAIRSMVQLRATGMRETDRAAREIENFAAANFPKNVRVTVGGPALVEKATNDQVVRSVWSSVIIAILSLFVIVSVVNRSAWAGLIGVLPLCVLVVFNFAVMGFLKIKLNIGTAMISSLTMGIGIDYTIHFLEAYKREYREARGGAGYLKKSYVISGIAIIADAVSTGAGFAVLSMSRFTMLSDFGLLVALALIMGAVVGLVVLPALLEAIKPKFITRGTDSPAQRSES